MLPIHRVAWLSVGASVATLLLKFSAYYLTDSVSLFSDAMESFVNLSAGLVALLVLTVVARPADENHPYGHDKAEYFSSGVEGALIIVAAISIIWAAWERFNVQQPLSNITQGVLISLAVSAINFGVAQYMLRAARQYASLTLEADARHLLTDVWTSVGVAVGLCVLVFAPADWQVLDPIVAILVALNIIHTGFDLLRRSMDGLMDTTLPVEDVRQIRTSIEQSIGVCYSYNQLRSRKSGSRRFIEFNLLLPGDTSVAVAHDLCDQLEDAIERRLSKTTVTIHVEPLEKYLDNPG